MADKESNKTLNILVPIIVAVLGLVGVMMQTDWFSVWATPATPTLTETSGNAPMGEPTLTSTVVPLTETATPVPPPLTEVFSLSGDGEAFVLVNNSATFTTEFVRTSCVHSGVYGLKMAFDINNSGSGGWGVQWGNSASGSFDASEYSALTFWVRGVRGDEKFQVGVKDSSGREYKIESADLLILSKDWQLVQVDLSQFAGVNMAFIENVNFGFEEKHSFGTLCVDDISLE